jgi:hypothetical protein
LPRGLEGALIAEALVGVDDEVEHAQELQLLAFGQYLDQQPVQADRLRDKPLGGACAGWRQPEQVASRVPRIPDALDQAARLEPGDDFGRRRAVERHPLAQCFLVDVFLRPQGVKDGELRGGHVGRDLSLPEPVVDLLGAPDQMSGMPAEVFMRG